VAALAVAATGLAAVASAGAVAAGSAAFDAAAFGATGDPVADAEGELETTTVDDFTSVVVQEPFVVVVLGDGVAAACALEVGAAATGGFEDGAGAAGAVVEGVLVELPAVEDTFEPAGAAGEGAGDACLAAVTVVSRAMTVVS
jgi:hypothetical protein